MRKTAGREIVSGRLSLREIKGKKVRTEKQREMIKLYEHNKTAYDAALSLLNDTGKAAVVHPTGTGKSFIGFKLCEEHPGSRILWLSPSSYIFRTQVENLKEATGGYVPENIVFCTYARLMLMSEEEMREMKPDYCILDEFHRCGAEMWGRGVRELLALFPRVPVLGLSATAIRYLDNRRNMADELFDGCIASELTLGDAIVRGILDPPKYVLSVFAYQKELEAYRRRVNRAKNRAVRDAAEEYLEALRRALDKADGIDEIFDKHMSDRTGKYLVFCASIEHMRQMMGKMREWVSRIDRNPHIYSVYSDDPGAEKEFEAFKADSDEGHLRLLFCIDALNEGVHVDDISGVILLRPTISPIIYKQQIGRALSVGSRKNAVIFDIVMNIENLYSIDSVREEMRAAMTYYRSIGAEELIINEQFKVTDEVRDCREVFRRLNDTLTASWEMMYEKAAEYSREHGDLEVPRRYRTEEGYSLGNWIDIQRRVYKGTQSGALGEERTARLEAIGMVWESRAERSWNRHFEAAKRYYEKYGRLDPSAGYTDEEGIALGRWLCHMRTERKRGRSPELLSDEHIAALDELGMIWDVPDYQWEHNYGAAVKYYREHGNLDVPVKYVDEGGNRLGLWLSNMRKSYHGRYVIYRITEEQIEKLSAIGMVWENKHDARWEKGFSEAGAYYEEHRDLEVPVLYETDTGYRLGEWISNQRERYRSGRMPRERIARLNTIGMIWEKEDPWEVRFALAKAYYEEHGDLNVPAGYKVGSICLSKWINEQKQIYRGNREGRSLSREQIERLEAIGMEWCSRSRVIWNERYEAVKEYYEEHGSLDIPRQTILSDGKRLNNWLSLQRRYYREGKLSEEQIEKLNELGMIWEKSA